ncbi:Ribokinase, partial [Paragonimus heterotremus]
KLNAIERHLVHSYRLLSVAEGVKKTSDASTGVAFITVVRESGENRIIVVPGANMQLSLSDIDSANRQGLLNSRVVVCQFEVDATATLHALRLAQSNGALTILNPAPPPVPSTEQGYFELLPELLAASDYCCPNETEALQMIHRCASNVATVEGSGDGVSPLLDEFLACLDWLTEQGVKQPMITLGSKGVAILLDSSKVPAELPEDVTIVQRRKSRKCATKGTVLLLSAPHIPSVIDTTGAGDSFVGALAYFVSSHPQLSTLEHVRRALWVASQSVRKVGTQSSYPNRDELHPTLFEASAFQWPSADR